MQHPRALPLCATVPVTLTGVSLGIQSICTPEDALFFPLSLVLHTAHIMHCIKYLLVFVRLRLHFLHENNQTRNRAPCVSSRAFDNGDGRPCRSLAFRLTLPDSRVFVCLISHLLRRAKTHRPRHILMHMLAHALPCSTCVLALCILDDT